MFIDKFELLCQEKGKNAKQLASEVGIPASTLSSWKKGSAPNAYTVKLLAEYFGKSIEYIISDDTESFAPVEKKRQTRDDWKTDEFDSFVSLPQRWLSLRHGDDLTTDQLEKIAKYVNCNSALDLLVDLNEFNPDSKNDSNDVIFDTDTLCSILDIMDRCSDSTKLRNVQLKLSRIVLYWIDCEYERERAILDILKQKGNRISTKKKNSSIQVNRKMTLR